MSKSIENPTNFQEFIQIYIKMIRNIVGKKIIKSTLIRKGELRGERKYSLNKDKIKEHVELDKFTHYNLKYYDKNILKKLNIKIQKKKS